MKKHPSPKEKLDEALRFYLQQKEPLALLDQLRDWIFEKLNIKLEDEEVKAIVRKLEGDKYLYYVLVKHTIETRYEDGSGTGKEIQVKAPVLTFDGEYYILNGGYVGDEENKNLEQKRLELSLKIEKKNNFLKTIVSVVLGGLLGWLPTLWQKNKEVNLFVSPNIQIARDTANKESRIFYPKDTSLVRIVKRK